MKNFIVKNKLLFSIILSVFLVLGLILLCDIYWIIKQIRSEPVVCIVIFLILAIVIIGLGVLIYDTEKIRKQYKIFDQIFKRINDNAEFTRKFESINQELLKIPHLNKLWIEFSETLVDYKDPNRNSNPQQIITAKFNTDQTEVYFNNKTIIYSQTHIALFEAIPGILTGLGLVGTFLAITMALSKFDTDPDKIQKSVEYLLTGLSFKFYSSLTGIAGAIIFLAVKKGKIANLESKIHKLQMHLNFILKRKTAEALLNDMLYEIKQQTSDLKDFLTDMDFSQQIKKALDNSFENDFKPLVTEMVGAIEQSNEVAIQNKEELKEAISNNMEDHAELLIENILKPISSKIDDLKTNLQNNLGTSISEAIKTSMEDISRSFGDAINEMKLAVGELKNLKQESSASIIETLIIEMKNSMKEMSGSIQEAMLGGTDGAVKDLSKTLSDTSSCLIKMQVNFDNLITRLEQQFKNSESARDNAVQSVITEILNKLSGFMEELNFKISDLVNIMNSNDNERQAKLIESVEIISKSVVNLLEEIDDSGSKSKEQAEQTINTIKSQAESLQSNMSESLSGSLQQIVEKVNELLNKIDSTTSEVNNASKNAVEKISSSCNSLIDNSNIVMESQNYRFTEWSNIIKEYIDQVKVDQTDIQNRFDNIIRKLNDALKIQLLTSEENTKIVKYLNDSSQEITNAANQFNLASSNISELMDKANKTQDEVNGLFNNFNNLNKDMEDKLKQNIQLWQTEKQAFGQLESTINILIGNLAGRTESFVEQSKSVQENFYKNITEKLGNEVSSLSTIVQTQSEIIGDLDELLENLRK